VFTNPSDDDDDDDDDDKYWYSEHAFSTD
jgi:hypothetical protein